MKAKCIDCLFFAPDDSSTAREGTCRRYPAIVVPDTGTVNIDGEIETYFQTRWPRMGDTDWCGEFTDKRGDQAKMLNLDPRDDG